MLCVFLFAVIITAWGEEETQWKNRPKRILHGTVVDITDHPHQVALLRKNKQVHCGGTLVGPDVVFTAAHCTHPNDVPRKDLSVLVGANSVDDPEGRVHEIKRVVKHPDFVHGAFDKDFSVIVLEEPIEMSERVRPITVSLNDHGAGTKGTVTGWGLTELGKPSKYLRASKLTLEKFDKCQVYFPRSHHPEITKNMICVKPSRSSSHFGDSGGPLIIDDKLVGIVSFGRSVDTLRKVTVFTKVKNVLDFIEDAVPEWKKSAE